jgi:GT2 family glycosyltransferase
VEPEEHPAPPPVVAVVVTHDPPTERFDEVLAALAAQDYPNLDVLVVDTGEDPVAPRVAEAVPSALVHRLDGNPGFGAAANAVFDLVAGAEFYVFSHDDVAPDPGAVTALVDAAERWEADVVGPKLVDWGDDHRLVQFGLAVDRLGVALPYVEHGERDQGQHDGLRDVFAVPGAFTLVRESRFREVGGFDEAIDFLGDDLSLSWRTRVAGGRVLVTSAARVRHAEAFAARPESAQRPRLAARHRLRVLLTSYNAWSLVAIVPQALVLTMLEALGALVAGRPGRAGAALGAWSWNLARLPSLRAARAAVAGFRSVPDRAVRRYQVRGLVGPRLQRLRVESGKRRVAAVPERGHMEVDPGAWSPGTAAVAATLAAVLVFGSRHLVTRSVPVIGEMVGFGGGAGDLLRSWSSGWRAVGVGAAVPPPLLVGAAGTLTGLAAGHAGLARMLLTVGLLPLGVVGAHRMAAPLGSKRAQVAAAIAYAAVPLPYDALGAGRWSALGAYAAAPWLVGRLARASGAAPFDRRPVPAGARAAAAGVGQHVAATGAVTALAALLVPQAPLLLVLMGAALAVGCLLTGAVRAALRIALAAAGGAVVAALAHLPTTLHVLGSPSARAAWWGGTRAEALSGLDVLALRTGPALAGAVTAAVLGAAAVPLLIGRRWRLGWAVRAWSLALACGTLVWARADGAVTLRLPAAGVVLAPAAAGLALAVALGLAALDHDVRGRSWRFGIRRIVVGLGGLALVAAAAPAVAGSVDGRWSAPRDDYTGLLGGLARGTAAASSRVLWVGDPDLVPGGQAWELDGGLTYTSVPAAVPAVGDLWPATGDTTGAARLGRALDDAVHGRTSRLGERLAPLGVEYLVVPRRLAPSSRGALSTAPDELLGALAEQLDLARVPVDPGLIVYRNAAFDAERDGGVGLTGPRGGGATSRAALAVQVAVWLALVAVVLRMRFGAPAAAAAPPRDGDAAPAGEPPSAPEPPAEAEPGAGTEAAEVRVAVGVGR